MKDENKKPLDLEDSGENEKDSGSTGIGLGLCFGSAFGLLVQALTGDAMWLPLGVAVGFGLGTAIGTTDWKNNKKDK